MFSYVAIFGFLGFILYASTFAYSVLQKTGDWKKNGIRMMISLIIMVIGFIGIQFS
jgi:amino acid permease